MNEYTERLVVEEDELSLRDYIAVLRRRRWPFLITGTAVAFVSLLVAFFWPSSYSSEATILIEEQEVPREFVTSTISSYAAQQVQVISQRVLTADSISNISEKFGLFRDDTGRRPPITEVAIEFRELMSLELVSADVIDPRSGRPQEATIAFKLSFEDENPRTAQQVTNELVTLFLDENLRTRTERVANTEEFLATESASLNAELVDLEQRIALFKNENGDALPELYQFNLSSLERRSTELSQTRRRLRELSQRRVELESELDVHSPNRSARGVDGTQLVSTREQLRLLEEEYRQKATIYHDKHPDLVQIKRRIEELNSAPEPDRIARGSNNPTYVILRTQLESIIAEMRGLEEQQAELLDKVTEYENIISRSPSVERDYNNLQRDYQGVQARYQDVRAKQRAAKLAENMEQERKGEKFVLVDPPSLPTEPSSPNRPAIVLLGIMLALGSAIGLVVVLESLDRSVYTDQDLTRLMGVPPFAVVGFIETSSDKAVRLKRRWYFATASALSLCVLIVAFHFLIRPLDVAWFALLNSLGI